MHDAPDDELQLTVVADFLRRELVPALAPHLAYQTRVAAHVLERVARGLAEAPAVAAEERRRLTALLGDVGDDEDLAALTQRLCDRIADAELGLDTPGLADLLWWITLNKLAVDQPRYVAYQRARAQWTRRPDDPR